MRLLLPAVPAIFALLAGLATAGPQPARAARARAVHAVAVSGVLTCAHVLTARAVGVYGTRSKNKLQ